MFFEGDLPSLSTDLVGDPTVKNDRDPRRESTHSEVRSQAISSRGSPRRQCEIPEDVRGDDLELSARLAKPGDFEDSGEDFFGEVFPGAFDLLTTGDGQIEIRAVQAGDDFSQVPSCDRASRA